MLTVNVITNNYGRVVQANSSFLHAATVGFNVTGAVESAPTYQKSLNGTDWFPFNTDYDWNIDGYIIQYALPPGIWNFYVREVGHEASVTTVSNYNLVIDLESHGLHSCGNTPKIVSNTLDVGSNKNLTIQTYEPNETVKIYASRFEEGSEVFSFPLNIVAEGTSDNNGVFIATLPTVRSGQKFYPTGQSLYSLESVSGNGITAGLTTNAKPLQLDINISIGDVTVSGRKIRVAITGGSGNYSIARDRLSSFSYLPNTDIELPFGRKYVIVRDNSTGAVYSRIVHILPAGQQTLTSIGLRSQFSQSSNSGAWSYGYIDKADSSYTAFNTFAARGDKSGWGKDSYQWPSVGFGSNDLPLESDAIVLMPNAQEDFGLFGFGNTQAVAKYTFANSGVFTSTKIKLKKPTIAANTLFTYYIKYIIKFNDNILYQGVLDVFGQEVLLSLENLTVQSGDVISIIADSASDSDNSSNYDELHVTFEGQLATTSYVAPTAPNAPTLSNGTGGSTTEINQNTTIKVNTTPTENWIVLYKNGYLSTMFKTAQVSAVYLYEFLGGVTGTYKAKSVANGVFSSAATTDFLVKSVVASTVTTPTITTASPISIGQPISLTVGSSGVLYIYKDGVQAGSINVSAAGTIAYTPTSVGSYTFKLFKTGTYSAATTAIVVNSGNTDCSAFASGFILGSNNGKTLKVLDINSYKVIEEIIDASTKSLKNANYIKQATVVSNYKDFANCFSFPNNVYSTALTSSNIGNVAGYSWNVLQDGSNTPILILTTTIANTYRSLANTDCSSKRILFAYSASISDPTLLPFGAFVSPDGIIKVNSLGIADPNGRDAYYKDYNIPAGTYYFFYKVEGSDNTPVKVVNKVLS